MRRSVLAGLVVVPLMLGCSSELVSRSERPAGQAASPIYYGTKDTTHTGVVALITDEGSSGISVCSGTLVQVKSNVGYVLTAAHCCNGSTKPGLVVMANDYADYAGYVGWTTPPKPAYPVVSGSVVWDTRFTGAGSPYDLCMLKFTGATTAMQVIPVATSPDGLAGNVQIEHVGYGKTERDSNNSIRYHATNKIDRGLTSREITYSEGNGVGGPCEGDSGGPALLPAGAAPASQKVVGVTSYGDANCSSYGSSIRVSAETGPTGFIGKYLADQSTGGTGTTTPADVCDQCQSDALGPTGACRSVSDACEANAGCLGIFTCFDGCAINDSACINACYSSATATSRAKFDAIGTCLCTTACSTECVSICGGGSSTTTTTTTKPTTTTTTTTATSTDTTEPQGCGFEIPDVACNECLVGSCCQVAADCAADADCVACAAGGDAAEGCATNALRTAFAGCMADTCGQACGTAGPTDTGAGGGGAGGAGAGVQSGSGGCRVEGSGAVGSQASLLALAALAFAARRRRR